MPPFSPNPEVSDFHYPVQDAKTKKGSGPNENVLSLYKHLGPLTKESTSNSQSKLDLPPLELLDSKSDGRDDSAVARLTDIVRYPGHGDGGAQRNDFERGAGDAASSALSALTGSDSRRDDQKTLADKASQDREHRQENSNTQTQPAQDRLSGQDHSGDAPERTRPSDRQDPVLSPEAARDARLVEQMRERGATPEEIDRFTRDLAIFRARQDISDAEKSRTLDQVERLMASRGEDPVDQDERRRIGMQIVAHAARPSEIDQGGHNTCNVTTLEERMFTRCPSRAAEVITTAVIDGSWTAPDGRRVRLDPTGISFVPGPEERNTYPRDGERSHASQIFQHVVINDALQRRDPPQFYRQDLTTSANDTGERLYYADNTPVMSNGRRVTSPTLTVNDIAELGERMTGDRGYVLVESSLQSGDVSVPIRNERELMDSLRDLRRRSQLPATVMVDANHRAFGGTGERTEDRWHVVSVTDFDPTTGRVYVSNQWGSRYDRWMSAGELYGAMRGVPR